MRRKTSENTLGKCYNHMENIQKYAKQPAIIGSKNLVKNALLKYCDYIRNLKKNAIIELQKIGVLFAFLCDYIESLHTFCNCKKYSESTVGIVTDVKPVVFTVDLFAVYNLRVGGLE